MVLKPIFVELAAAATVGVTSLFYAWLGFKLDPGPVAIISLATAAVGWCAVHGCSKLIEELKRVRLAARKLPRVIVAYRIGFGATWQLVDELVEYNNRIKQGECQPDDVEFNARVSRILDCIAKLLSKLMGVSSRAFRVFLKKPSCTGVTILGADTKTMVDIPGLINRHHGNSPANDIVQTTGGFKSWKHSETNQNAVDSDAEGGVVGGTRQACFCVTVHCEKLADALGEEKLLLESMFTGVSATLLREVRRYQQAKTALDTRANSENLTEINDPDIRIARLEHQIADIKKQQQAADRENLNVKPDVDAKTPPGSSQ